MKLDLLAIAAHPDDTELACSGTLALHVAQGKKVGVVDLTRGEMGTRGTPEIRDEEAKASAKILGLAARENLRMDDVFFENNKENQLAVVKIIRKYRPEVLLVNAVEDRHPDHGKASELASTASFMAGLRMISTEDEGKEQEAWRPKAVYHYIQSNYIKPDFVVDVTDYWELKMESVRAFKSQFYDPNSKEPETFISSPHFMKLLEARAIELGYSIGAKYGEGFTIERNIGVKSLFDLK